MIFQIMTLKAFDMHKCIFCPYKSIRNNLKRHLTSAGKKGVRCPGLKKVIPKDVWVDAVLPYYVMDGPMPDFAAYIKTKRSSGRPQVKFESIKLHHNKKRRLSESGEFDSQGERRLSQDELLELLHCGGDPDMQWLVGVLREKGGCAKLREVYTVAKKSVPPKPLAPRDALALQIQLFLIYYHQVFSPFLILIPS